MKYQLRCNQKLYDFDPELHVLCRIGAHSFCTVFVNVIMEFIDQAKWTNTMNVTYLYSHNCSQNQCETLTWRLANFQQVSRRRI